MNQPFDVKCLYYGARERLVTHIIEIKSLAERLETTPYDIKAYFTKRLDTIIDIEGNTMKVKGFLKLPLLNMLLEEIRLDNIS